MCYTTLTMIEAGQKIEINVAASGSIWYPFQNEQPRQEVALKFKSPQGRSVELKGRKVIGSDGEKRLDIVEMPAVSEEESEEVLGIIQLGLIQMLPLESASVTLSLSGTDRLTTQLIRRFRAASNPESEHNPTIKLDEISLPTGGRLRIAPNK